MGSTNALTDATGNVISSATYDSFGNATGNIGTRYQYTGREFDSFTGLHYYRARFYDAQLGRFISEDPIGLGGGINQFGYVNGNPLSFRDPDGKIPVLIPAVIGIGILIAASPSYVNAPGCDPVYLDDKGSGLFMNAAGGAVGGAVAGLLLKRFVAPFIGRVIAGSGDDIIELGISKGPIYSQQVSTKVINPCVVCSKGNADALGLSDELVGRAAQFESPNFVENFPKIVKDLPDGNFEPVPNHYATKVGDKILDSALEANLRLRNHDVTLNKVYFSLEEYAKHVAKLR